MGHSHLTGLGIAIVAAPTVVWVPVVIAGAALTELGYRQTRRDSGPLANH